MWLGLTRASLNCTPLRNDQPGLCHITDHLSEDKEVLIFFFYAGFRCSSKHCLSHWKYPSWKFCLHPTLCYPSLFIGKVLRHWESPFHKATGTWSAVRRMCESSMHEGVGHRGKVLFVDMTRLLIPANITRERERCSPGCLISSHLLTQFGGIRMLHFCQWHHHWS